LPEFEKTKPRNLWPPDAQMLGYFSDHAMVITSGVFLFLVVLWALVSWLNHHWIGPSRAKADKRMPIFSTIAQIRCASMMSSLAAFTSSGVSFSESMQRMGGEFR